MLQGDLSSEDTGDGDRVWETTWDTSARVQLARNTSDARRYQETIANDGKPQPGPHITMQAPTDSVRSVCKSGEIRIASEQMLMLMQVGVTNWGFLWSGFIKLLGNKVLLGWGQ